MALNGYTKLSSSILASSIWQESNETRLVWITMLALTNAAGVVEASVPGLASFARVPLPACEEALRALQAPDPYSRTKDHEGRRIEAVEGGWRLLNYALWRSRVDNAQRRDYFRKQKQKMRANGADMSEADADVHTLSTPMSTMSTQSTQAEAEAEAVRSYTAYTNGGTDVPAGDVKADDVKADDAPPPKKRATHRGHVAGFCDWLCLPTKLRDQFVQTAGEDISTPEARAAVEARVRQWADRVREKWEGRKVGDTIWAFWTARWRERVGGAPSATPTRHAVVPEADGPVAELTPERVERLRIIRAQVAQEWVQ
jgi:hypothetical protein